jgi:Holliday junction resolvasome RuvABC endonuclease subunit
MIWIGIDPGLSGGIAIIHQDLEAMAWKMPPTERDIADLLLSISKMDVHLCFIESVHSLPRQGVASTFKFGRSYGFLRGLLVAFKIPFDEVSPLKWQRAMGCLSHGNKNVTKAKAQQLFPQLTVTHAIADALLIAEYCRRSYRD